MHFIPPAIRGPLFMVVSTGSYVINDTFMKLATVGLPPYQVLFLRAVAATLWMLPLLFALGYARRIPLIVEPRVLARSTAELLAVLAYIVALANMPIANAIALGQVTPLLVLIGAAFLFRELIGAVLWALIGVGFAGALMIAQPTLEGGISIFALLALGNALFSSVRDLVGRRIEHHVPGMIVAFSAVVIVLVGAAVAHLASETWVAPQARHLWLLAASGFFLIFGHFFIFMAYRAGPTGTVAPFYYCFTVWAVISGFIVFRELPNLMATAGILLVVGSGMAIVALEARKPKLTVVA